MTGRAPATFVYRIFVWCTDILTSASCDQGVGIAQSEVPAMCGRETQGIIPMGQNKWFSGIDIMDTGERTQRRPTSIFEGDIGHCLGRQTPSHPCWGGGRGEGRVVRNTIRFGIAGMFKISKGFPALTPGSHHFYVLHTVPHFLEKFVKIFK